LLFGLGNVGIADFLLEILYRIPAIIIAISFHECAHAYAAYRCGDPTARNLGRMTLNPIAHFDPVGLIMLLIVRFGWAKPVPINTRNFKNPRRDEIIVSLAGVATNLLIAFVVYGIIFVLQVFTSVDSNIVYRLLESAFFINLSFFVFNLLPIPPLDGYRVISCVLGKFTRSAAGIKVFYYLERYSVLFLIGILIFNSRTGFMANLVMAVWNGIALVYAALFGLFL